MNSGQEPTELRLSEDRFRDLIEHSNLGYIIIRDHKALYVNEELVRLYGYDSADEIYELESTQLLFAPEHRDDTRESKMISGETPSGDLELIALRKDGSRFWVNRRAFVVEWNGEPAICSVRIDITEQRDADETLRKSHGEMAKLFQHTFENTPIGLALITPDGNRFMVNKALAKFLGYSVEDLTNTAMLSTNDDKDALAESMRLRQRALDGEIDTYTNTRSYRHKDGHTVWGEVTATLVRDDDGQPLYFIAQTVDITERKRTEDSLKESEERYRVLFDNAATGIGRSRIGDGKMLLANEKLAEMFGYDDVASFIDEYVLSENYVEPALRDRFVEAFAESDVQMNDFELLRRDGSKFTFRAFDRINREQDSIDFVGIDITDLKDTEARLRESEAKFRSLFENATACIGRTDIETGEVLLANKKLAQTFGYDDVDEFIEEFDFSQHYPDGHNREQRIAFLEARQDESIRAPFTDRNGNVIYTEAQVRVDRNNGWLDFVSIDVTDHKKTEDRLRESESKYRAIFDNATAGIGRTDLKTGEVLIANKRLAHIFGYDDVDAFVTEFNFRDHYPDGDTRENRLNLYDKRPGEIIEAAFTDKDGNLVYTESEVLVDKDKGTIDFVVIDITQEHMAVRANAAKSEFLSAMSHELRTPLNAIMGFAQVLNFDQRDPLSDRQRRSLTQILSSGEYLTSLINEVLELSKIESGKLELTIEAIDPLPIIDECRAIARSMAEPRAIVVECGGRPDPMPVVMIDQVRFKQVMLNILSNAVKYNEDGGHIMVRGEIIGDMFRINVTDTGIGIPESDLERLFEPFVRVGTTINDVEGTGIGLAISKQLIDAMNGAIGCAPNAGGGSTFWLDLPIAGASPLTAVETDEDGVQQPRLHLVDDGPAVRKILYIEDNATNLQLMETVFASLPDMDLITAIDAEQGISLARDLRPDAILMDVGLPGIDGIEATKIIKERDSLSHMPVIAVSAAAMKADVRRADSAGFYAYLTKPIDITETIDVIRTAISEAEKAQKLKAN